MPLPFITHEDPFEVKGTKLAIEQPDKYRFIRGQGWTTIKSWAGNGFLSIRGKAEELELAGWTNITVEKVGGIWTVEGTIEGLGEGDPGPENGSNETWEIDSVSESSDIMNHPMFQGIEDDELRTLLEAINNPVAGTSPDLTDPNAQTLYELLLRKVDTWNYEVPSLRHTTSPAPDVVRVAGFQELWTPAQLNVPSGRVSAMVTEFTNNNPFGDVDGHTWGWLNMVLRVTEDVQGRSSLTEEWLLMNWSNDLYASYSG